MSRFAVMRLRRPWQAMLLGLCALLAACQWTLVHEVRSEYSHIRVYDQGSQRALLFVGADSIETIIDRKEPHRLQHGYLRTMMAGLIYQPQTASALLIGLGGGAMVKFLDRYFPAIALDTVEIDPEIVTVARDYFGAVPRRVFVEDGREYLRRSPDRYDLILIDAHLHPGESTDSSGHPLSLRTEAFYGSLRERLRAGGIVAFNMVQGRDSESYVESIRAAFAAVHVFQPSFTGNIIVLAGASFPPEEELRRRAQALDRRAEHGFSFERLLEERKMKPSL